MAAPTPSDRVIPSDLADIYNNKDGAFSTITLAADTNISFAEINPQPFGIEGGEPIMMVNAFNVAWRIKRARQLKDATPISCNVHYTPDVMDQILALINVETTVTNEWGDTGDQWAAYGYLRSFIPQPLVEGEPPVAAIVIEITNWDPTNNVEAGPNFVTAGGTD